MRAIVQIGARRQGRVKDHCGPHVSISQQTIECPDDVANRELAVSVSVGEIKRALTATGAQSDEIDTVEFMVRFES